jgi:hypothetical protein
MQGLLDEGQKGGERPGIDVGDEMADDQKNKEIPSHGK